MRKKIAVILVAFMMSRSVRVSAGMVSAEDIFNPESGMVLEESDVNNAETIGNVESPNTEEVLEKEAADGGEGCKKTEAIDESESVEVAEAEEAAREESGETVKTVKTVKTEEPAETEEPEGPAEPAETEEPEGSEEPAETEKPEGPAEPTETKEPEGTAEPAETKEPEETEEPAETEEPEGTAEPTETEEPEGTAEPAETKEPERTAEPAITEKPMETGEPTGSERPTEAAEPFQTENPSETETLMNGGRVDSIMASKDADGSSDRIENEAGQLTEGFNYIYHVLFPANTVAYFDPENLSGKGQIFSDWYTVENYGNTDVAIKIKNVEVYCQSAEDTYEFSAEEITAPPSDVKRLNVDMVWVNENEGTETVLDVVAGGIYDETVLILLAAEYSEQGEFVSLSQGGAGAFYFAGTINASPDAAWQNGEVTVRFDYEIVSATEESREIIPEAAVTKTDNQEDGDGSLSEGQNQDVTEEGKSGADSEPFPDTGQSEQDREVFGESGDALKKEQEETDGAGTEENTADLEESREDSIAAEQGNNSI